MVAPRPRAAYRAVYMSSPLKFHTTLHAFARSLPKFHVDAWKKDPHAWERYKWRSAKERRRGRWHYWHGPLSGVQAEGWPEPGLLGRAPLVQVVARAQAEKLQDQIFWQQVAERTVQLRDVLSVADVTLLLDALVTAEHRHLLLMKTLTREIIDDADKLLFVEVAVIANAYAHFKVVSQPLLEALATHTMQLLSGNAPHTAPRGGDVDADPSSFSLLLKAFAALNFKKADFWRVVGVAVVERVESMPFPVLADVLACFAESKEPFRAEPEFWALLASKVPGNRMASLCPAFKAVALLAVEEPKLHEAFTSQILDGLRGAPAPPTPQLSSTVLGLREVEPRPATPMPAFGVPAVPQDMLELALRGELAVPAGQAEAEGDASIFEFQTEFAPTGGQLIEEESPDAEPAPRPRRKTGWYSPTSRCALPPRFPFYHDFDATETFNRNRRAMRIGEALQGVHACWERRRQAGGAAVLLPAEVELVEAAMPMLQSSVQGLSAQQLLACAELHAELPNAVDTTRDIIQESVRKLSNFKPAELRRLRDASRGAGVFDLYLERARRRRFPKFLRKELRDEER